MEAQYFFYFLVILKTFIPDCAGSPLNEPLSSHNDSMLERDINDNAENTQINIRSNVTNDNNKHIAYHTIGNITIERGDLLVQNCNEKDDIVKKIVQLEDKTDELMGITKKVQETNHENDVLFKNKTDELMGITKKVQETNLENGVLLKNKLDELMSKTKKEQDTNLENGVLLKNKTDELMGITKKVQETNLENGVLLKNKTDELMGITKKVQETNLENGVLLKNKLDELMSKTKKEQETNLENGVLLKNKLDELMSKTKKEQESNLEKNALLENKINELTGEIKNQHTNMEKVLKMLNEVIVQQKNNSQASAPSPISKQANGLKKYPAFTGSSYLELDKPGWFYDFNISMEVKATEPVTDGIIMYCAEPENPGGFMSLAVRQGRLEFRILLGWVRDPLIVLTANTTLPANEWTNIEVSRVNHDVSLRINSGAALKGWLSEIFMYLAVATPLFIGGVDESTVLRNYTSVSGGFKGCIKHAQLKMYGYAGELTHNIDNIETAAIKSSNVQKCCDGNDE